MHKKQNKTHLLQIRLLRSFLTCLWADMAGWLAMTNFLFSIAEFPALSEAEGESKHSKLN